MKAFDKEELGKDNRVVERLETEISIHRVLEHQGIPRVHEIHESEKQILMVMELINGSRILKFDTDETEDKTIEITTLEELKIVFFELISILQYFKFKGLVHRDLKPLNVLLDEEKRVHLIDFGLAVSIEDFEKCSYKLGGTPGYVAPEVFKFRRGEVEGKMNSKVDIFSTGVLLYNFLFNSQLFLGETFEEILENNKNCNFQFKPFEQILTKFRDKMAYDLCLKMLNLDQNKRLSVEQALNHKFFDSIREKEKIFGFKNEFEFYDQLKILDEFEEDQTNLRFERELLRSKDFKFMRRLNIRGENRTYKKVKSTSFGDISIPLLTNN